MDATAFTAIRHPRKTRTDFYTRRGKINISACVFLLTFAGPRRPHGKVSYLCQRSKCLFRKLTAQIQSRHEGAQFTENPGNFRHIRKPSRLEKWFPKWETGILNGRETVSLQERGGIHTHIATLNVDSTLGGVGVHPPDANSVAKIFLCDKLNTIFSITS